MRQPITDARYDSIVDFLASLETANHPRNADVLNDWTVSRDHGDWYGADCRTGADVQAKMRDGWPQGRERLNDLRAQISNIELAPRDKRRKLTRGPSGDSLDIHSVYAGRLDVAWRVARRQTTLGPQKIELAANMICSGAEHADVLFWRGAAATVLADLLEQAGYMVRLVVLFGGEICASDEKISCRITVKEHGQPFDVTSTSAVIMPGFFRALGHGWAVAHSTTAISSPSMSVRQGVVEAGEILLSHNVRDHGSALNFVNETIAKLNANQIAA